MNKTIFTIYIGDPQSVSAITPPSRNLANPKSAVKISTQIMFIALQGDFNATRPNTPYAWVAVIPILSMVGSSCMD